MDRVRVAVCMCLEREIIVSLFVLFFFFWRWEHSGIRDNLLLILIIDFYWNESRVWKIDRVEDLKDKAKSINFLFNIEMDKINFGDWFIRWLGEGGSCVHFIDGIFMWFWLWSTCTFSDLRWISKRLNVLRRRGGEFLKETWLNQYY